jgi:hypothetical protein
MADGHRGVERFTTMKSLPALRRAFRPIACLLAVVASAPGLALEPDSRGYPLTSAIWPERTIPVCWDVGDATFRHYAARREGVRLAVRDSWEAHSDVRFVGWQRCTGVSNNGVSIAIRDDTPHVKLLGSRLRNVPGGVVLNFEYRNFPCHRGAAACDRITAIHEFGHVLAFAHEQNRPDTPDYCRHPQGANGDVLYGTWDLHSVMNYCNPKWSGNGTLSATDVAMVRTYYGDPLGGSPAGVPAAVLDFLLD